MVERIKKAIEPFYADVCRVYVNDAVTRDSMTRFEKRVVYDTVPCRVSAKAYLFGENAAKKSDNTLKVTKKAKLFVPTEYYIEPGSLIEVYSKGKKTLFCKSGSMSCYSSHNEVMVELWKDYA